VLGPVASNVEHYKLCTFKLRIQMFSILLFNKFRFLKIKLKKKLLCLPKFILYNNSGCNCMLRPTKEIHITWGLCNFALRLFEEELWSFLKNHSGYENAFSPVSVLRVKRVAFVSTGLFSKTFEFLIIFTAGLSFCR